MEFTTQRTINYLAILMFLAALTQALYTGLSLAGVDVPRQILWGGEGLLFTVMAAFAGAALAQAGRLHLVWSAIMAAAILNVVQVGIGLTMFGPFFEVAGENEALGPLAKSVVAFSFMVYNAAKILLALSLIVCGSARMAEGGKAIGGVSVLVGIVAMAANTASMAFGRDVTGELPLAGGTGVLATVLLAICLFKISKDA